MFPLKILISAEELTRQSQVIALRRLASVIMLVCSIARGLATVEGLVTTEHLAGLSTFCRTKARWSLNYNRAI